MRMSFFLYELIDKYQENTKQILKTRGNIYNSYIKKHEASI